MDEKIVVRGKVVRDLRFEAYLAMALLSTLWFTFKGVVGYPGASRAATRKNKS